MYNTYYQLNYLDERDLDSNHQLLKIIENLLIFFCLNNYYKFVMYVSNSET